MMSSRHTIGFYYKLAIFKCMHKVYNGRLPSTLTNCIAKKRSLSYSIRARDSLLVPRFNTRFMKGSVAYRGTVLWNMLFPDSLTLLTQASVTL